MLIFKAYKLGDRLIDKGPEPNFMQKHKKNHAQDQYYIFNLDIV